MHGGPAEVLVDLASIHISGPRQRENVSGPGDGVRKDPSMNRRIVRAFLAAATAGAAVASLAVMGASAAGAGEKPMHQPMPLVYTQSAAGYFTSGTRFRFVAATLKVPAPQAVEGNNGPAALSLFSSKHAATLLVKAGGGAGSIVYDNGLDSGTVSLAPHVGNI